MFLAVMVFLVGVSGYLGEVSWQKFVHGIPRFGSYISRTLPPVSPETLWADLGSWMWAGTRWVGLLFDTVLIAFVATTLGVVAGFFLSFPAARNLAGGVVGYQLARRFLELMRTVPERTAFSSSSNSGSCANVPG
jgi:phosphonate transport system permease protein